MTKVYVMNRIPQYLIQSDTQVDLALEDMAKEIEREAKQIVPHKTGKLQSTISTNRVSKGHWIAAAGKSYYGSVEVPYARRREFEEDVTFSEPGKQAHYMRDSAERVFQKAETTFKRYMK